MYVFFDCEMTDLKKDADLISIGLITDGDQRFYGEITDFDRSKCSQFVKDYILPNMGNQNVLNGDFYWVANTKEKVGAALKKWLVEQAGGETIYLVTDCGAYDYVFLMDLLTNGGSVFDLNLDISPAYEDVNPMLADFLDASNDEAFDYSREEFVKDFCCLDVVQQNKHNALFDAYILREIYLFLIKELDETDADYWED